MPNQTNCALSAVNPNAENSLDNPCAVVPRDDMVPVAAPMIAPARSMQVIRMFPAAAK